MAKKPQTKDIKDMSSEELALALDQEYRTILQAQTVITQAQNNINVIRKSLTERTDKEKADE